MYILVVESLVVFNLFFVLLVSEYKFLYGFLSLMDFK